MSLSDEVPLDSMIILFERTSTTIGSKEATKGLPTVEGNLGVWFQPTSIIGDADSLSVWMKTLYRTSIALSPSYTICANDSFNIFNNLDWTSASWYCWPNQNSSPIMFGPCDGVVIYFRYTDNGAGNDSLRLKPFATVQ